jgi:hypothetical protein
VHGAVGVYAVRGAPSELLVYCIAQSGVSPAATVAPSPSIGVPPSTYPPGGIAPGVPRMMLVRYAAYGSVGAPLVTGATMTAGDHSE